MQTYQNLETWSRASLQWARNKAVAKNAFIQTALISLTSAMHWWLLQCGKGGCATIQLIEIFSSTWSDQLAPKTLCCVEG